MPVITTRESQILAPQQLALSLDYVKLHLKALTNTEDFLILGWIAAATQYFEELTGRQLITATWEYWLDAFPTDGKIELPKPPLRSVESVSYIDGDGDLMSFSDGASPDVPSFAVYAPAGPYAARGWIEAKSGLSWPSPRVETGAVRIRFVAGYGDAATDVPALVTAALCALVGHFEQFRSEVHQSARGETVARLPFGVQQMLDGFKYSAHPTQVLRTTTWV